MPTKNKKRTTIEDLALMTAPPLLLTPRGRPTGDIARLRSGSIEKQFSMLGFVDVEERLGERMDKGFQEM